MREGNADTCAEERDAATLLEIYSYYVEKTAITFEYETPSIEEFTQRIHDIKVKYPYIVAEEKGEILGYAYGSAFHPRAAYGWCAEMSVYVRHDRRAAVQEADSIEPGESSCRDGNSEPECLHCSCTKRR